MSGKKSDFWSMSSFVKRYIERQNTLLNIRVLINALLPGAPRFYDDRVRMLSSLCVLPDEVSYTLANILTCFYVLTEVEVD